jgi:hypothetical protein
VWFSRFPNVGLLNQRLDTRNYLVSAGLGLRHSGCTLSVVVRRLLLIAGMVMVFNFSWALASPIGSSYDDNYHLASIWCSHGIRKGICESDSTQSGRRVPLPIANAGICYLGDNEKSARCSNDELKESPRTMIETGRIAGGSILV